MEAGASLCAHHHGILFLIFSSCPQSMCEVLSPGLAVSVLKAIFQEVHVQVSNVISYPPVLDVCSLCVWGLPTCPEDWPHSAQCSAPAELRDSLAHCKRDCERQTAAKNPAGPLSTVFSALRELFPFAPILLTCTIVFAGSALGSMRGPGVADSAFTMMRQSHVHVPLHRHVHTLHVIHGISVLGSSS